MTQEQRKYLYKRVENITEIKAQKIKASYPYISTEEQQLKQIEAGVAVLKSPKELLKLLKKCSYERLLFAFTYQPFSVPDKEQETERLTNLYQSAQALKDKIMLDSDADLIEILSAFESKVF